MALSGVTVVLNGHTYNDASFLNNGHQSNFLTILSDMLVEIAAGNATASGYVTAASTQATNAATSATNAATSATNAANSATAAANVVANNLACTSTTSNDIGTGSKTFTVVESNIPFSTTMWVKITKTSDATKWMWGNVTAWNSGTKALTVNVTDTQGSGSAITDWSIISTGPKGPTGATADTQETTLKASAFLKFKVI